MAIDRRTFVKGAAALGGAIAFLPLGSSRAKVVRDKKIVGARIHPAIGIARVGNSEDQFFIGPEVPGVFPDVAYKDTAGAVKRQAARFRIYGVNKYGEIVRELTSRDATIEWSVHLANSKASWYVWEKALDIARDAPSAECAVVNSNDVAFIPTALRNAHIKDRRSLVIDGGEQSVKGRPNKTSAPFVGNFMFPGRHNEVYLGELRTDSRGRLLVLGGYGLSYSPTNRPIQGQDTWSRDSAPFPNRKPKECEPPSPPSNRPFGPSIDNDEWTDDMSDGPVMASVVYKRESLPVEPAWVAVLPPNYVPQRLYTFRTLWDVITETMICKGFVHPPKKVSFRADILPIFTRLADMQWTNEGQALEFGWGSPSDFHSTELIERLADASDANAGFRRNLFERFRNPDYKQPEAGKLPFMLGDDNSNASESPIQWLALLPSWYKKLKRWSNGDFVNDLSRRVEPTKLSRVPMRLRGEALDRAALESVEGDAFHPAPELQWIMRVPSMYDGAYRIRHRDYGQLDWGSCLTPEIALGPEGPLRGAGPGDLTRWGGVPWQCDITRCGGSYQEYVDMFGPTIWPMRAPNGVLREEEYRIVMNKKLPMKVRQDAFFNRSQWLRAVRMPNQAKSGKLAVDNWWQLGFILPRPGPGDGGFPDWIFVETGFSLPEPPVTYRDVSIWINQHLS